MPYDIAVETQVSSVQFTNQNLPDIQLNISKSPAPCPVHPHIFPGPARIRARVCHFSEQVTKILEISVGTKGATCKFIDKIIDLSKIEYGPLVIKFSKIHVASQNVQSVVFVRKDGEREEFSCVFTLTGLQKARGLPNPHALAEGCTCCTPGITDAFTLFSKKLKTQGQLDTYPIAPPVTRSSAGSSTDYGDGTSPSLSGPVRSIVTRRSVIPVHANPTSPYPPLAHTPPTPGQHHHHHGGRGGRSLVPPPPLATPQITLQAPMTPLPVPVLVPAPALLGDVRIPTSFEQKCFVCGPLAVPVFIFDWAADAYDHILLESSWLTVPPQSGVVAVGGGEELAHSENAASLAASDCLNFESALSPNTLSVIAPAENAAVGGSGVQEAIMGGGSTSDVAMAPPSCCSAGSPTIGGDVMEYGPDWASMDDDPQSQARLWDLSAPMPALNMFLHSATSPSPDLAALEEKLGDDTGHGAAGSSSSAAPPLPVDVTPPPPPPITTTAAPAAACQPPLPLVSYAAATTSPTLYDGASVRYLDNELAKADFAGTELQDDPHLDVRIPEDLAAEYNKYYSHWTQQERHRKIYSKGRLMVSLKRARPFRESKNPRGDERKGLFLEFCKATYKHHRTMQSIYMGLPPPLRRAVLAEPQRFAHSHLSTSFGVHIAVITTDGKMVFARRSNLVAQAAYKWVCGVVEGMNDSDVCGSPKPTEATPAQPTAAASRPLQQASESFAASSTDHPEVLPAFGQSKDPTSVLQFLEEPHAEEQQQPKPVPEETDASSLRPSIMHSISRGLAEEMGIVLSPDEQKVVKLLVLYFKEETHEWGIGGVVDLRDPSIQPHNALSSEQLERMHPFVPDAWENMSMQCVPFTVPDILNFVVENQACITSSGICVALIVLMHFYGRIPVESVLWSHVASAPSTPAQ